MTEYLVCGDGPHGRRWIGRRHIWEKRKSMAQPWSVRENADKYVAFLNKQDIDDGYTFRVVEVPS